MDLEKMLESYRADMMIKPREERVHFILRFMVHHQGRSGWKL